jgi:diguanylate cyclase (GGDEF)-like protein
VRRSIDGDPEPSTFVERPRVVHVYTGLVVAAALVLPVLLRHAGVADPRNSTVSTLAALLIGSALNVELGRLVEGGLTSTHRPHKALSAWSFCAALLLPLPYLVPVVALSYAHTRWRGLRVALWKWVGSAAIVALCGLATATMVHAILGAHSDLMVGDGRLGLAAVVTAAAVFLLLEVVLLHGSAYLNRADDEQWLRRTLRSRSFYLTEASVLLVGGLSAAVWDAGRWFLVLLLPAFALTQRAVLTEPLRERVLVDDKTGLLRFESWRDQAGAALRRSGERSRACSVAFADLDHFKSYNDTYGHIAGDAALAAVATALRSELRTDDLVGRFGGEEFCLFLPEAPAHQAAMVAERLRRAVATCPLPGSRAHVSVSIGVVTVPAGAEQPQLADVLTAADQALLAAKRTGRDRVFSEVYDGHEPERVREILAREPDVA